MIINFKPINFFTKKESKQNSPDFVFPNPTKFNALCGLSKDTVSFTSQKELKDSQEYKYISAYRRGLDTDINPNLRTILKQNPNLKDIDKAVERCKNFSNYYKRCVGLELLDKKQYFEGACKYLIMANAGMEIPEFLYPKYAKRAWKFMSDIDPYWKSDAFVNYLKKLDSNAGVNSTLDAIEEIRKEETSKDINFCGHGYSSGLRYFKPLLKAGAYSGKELENASLEHVLPAHLYEKGKQTQVHDSNIVLETSIFNGTQIGRAHV